jgi:NADH:ubiquinone oxidoreductase subunit E
MPCPEHPDLAGSNAATQGAIDRIIAAHRHIPGALVTVLREAHAAAGCLSPPLLDYISAEMNLPRRSVHDVAAFHRRAFEMPEGRHKVKLCTGSACGHRGTEPVLGRVRAALRLAESGFSEDRRFSLDTVRCLGACGLAPVMVVDGDTHGAVDPDHVLEILARYP